MLRLFATYNAVWLQHYSHVHCKKQKKCQKNLWLVIFSTQDANMLDVFDLRARQEFDSIEAAQQFYLDYAKMAGFSVRTMRTSKETKHWVCNRQGFMKLGKENDEPQTDKRSMRIGCPACAKVKEDKKRKIWYFDRIEEAHNHKLQPSARMVRYMHAHKQRKTAMDDLFAIMSRSGVPNQAAMNVMSELYGGRQNWPFPEKDIQNM
jgi:hypothetical protein